MSRIAIDRVRETLYKTFRYLYRPI